MIRTERDPADRDERLNEALLAYLEALEPGATPDRREFLDRYPEFTAELTDFFACRDRVEGIVASLRDAGGRGISTEVRDFREHYGDLPLPPATQRAAALPAPLPPTGDGAGPRLLGDFCLSREVGRGGMGIVYEAEQISLGRRVALKVLPFAAGLDSRQLQRFKNEAQAAALLQHPNIVPVYAVGCEEGIHYYAMQFIEGRSLAAWIEDLHRDQQALLALPALRSVVLSATGASTCRSRQGGGPAVRAIAELGWKAATALEYAHQQGVIHRDVKPGNLLLDDRGELWITDFGLALFQAGAGVTVTGELIGTLRYMSPEQALARRGVVDHRTDVYSLGVTLYELLTLQPIFPDNDGHELLYRIAHEEPVAPRSVKPEIAIDLETILLKSLSKNPADRYATAGDMADDLRRFLEHKPIRARRPTLLDKVAKWSRRHRPIVAVALVALLVAAAALVVSNVLIAHEQMATKEAYARERQRAQEALEERVRAEQNFRQARKAVDFFVELSQEDLLDRPLFLEVRTTLLEAALSYYQDFIEQHGDDPRIQADLEDSKGRAALILRDLSAVHDGHRFELLTFSEFQDDLGLSDAQRSRVAERSTELMCDARAMAGEMRKMEPQERRKHLLDRVRRSDQAVAKILTREQVWRFGQLTLQLQGPRAFTNPGVIAALGLSRRQIHELRQSYSREKHIQLNEVWRQVSVDTKLGWVAEKVVELRRQSMERVLAALTPEQRERWQEMTGEPCKWPLGALLGSRRIGAFLRDME
jgi:hypothetical protein